MPKFNIVNIGEVELRDDNVSFTWEEVLWDEVISVTGKRRNNHRGYQAVVDVRFRQQDELLQFAQDVFTATQNGDPIQFIGDDGVVHVVPTDFERVEEYQIRRREAFILLKGDVQQERQFLILGILCGSTTVTCGQTNVLSGG